MAAARKPFVAGNWKMHKTVAEAVELVKALRERIGGIDGVRVAVAPPFTAIHPVAQLLTGSGIEVAGQNVHWESQGAFTGEISCGMLAEAGATCVIVGHSERRQYFGETDETVNKRARAALAAGLTPIVCVGETLEEREADRTLEVVGRQVRGGLAGLTPAQLEKTVIAYEPVWAIGTGEVATPEDAQEVCGALRERLAELYDSDVAAEVRILYGGSVKSGNIAGIMAQPDVDGALVGGASLDADEFVKICRFPDATG